ncbi:MAG: TetR family transcriptional regulator [Saprospiraceae bacterium]|nr:TetR family transcriptional regulator [Saprospiraceae bacterium]
MKTEIANKKQFIISAAAELFKDKGYKATSIRDLAAKVGLEPSSIYSHIRSKEDLLSDICMTCADRFTAGMNDIYFMDISPRKKLKALIDLHLSIAYDIPASATVFNDEWKFLQEPVMSQFIEARKDYEKKFKKILSEGRKEGKFEFVNTEIVFNIIIKMISWSYSATNKYPKEELESELTTFILKSLNN